MSRKKKEWKEKRKSGKGTYSLDYHCQNCGCFYSVSYPHGRKAPPGRSTTCPNCKCSEDTWAYPISHLGENDWLSEDSKA